MFAKSHGLLILALRYRLLTRTDDSCLTFDLSERRLQAHPQQPKYRLVSCRLGGVHIRGVRRHGELWQLGISVLNDCDIDKLAFGTEMDVQCVEVNSKPAAHAKKVLEVRSLNIVRFSKQRLDFIL